MKTFSANGYRLTTASPNLRLVLTLFLLFTLLGYATNLVLTYRQTGFSIDGITSYYRGTVDASGEVITYPKSATELLMNAHFHLFMMPLTLLVLCHVFYMVSVSDGLKRALTWLSFAGVLLEIAGPWGVRFLSAGMAPVLLLGHFLLAGTLALLILGPLYELWARPHVPAVNGGGRGPHP
ncbi:MAG: hypothetical protein Q8R92_09480 [Deltaproteobacteria bacterium]|nr:hypothetical protein [Deltaproteobacteria bacterium]